MKFSNLRNRRNLRIISDNVYLTRLHIGVKIKALLADQEARAVLAKFITGPLPMGDISQISEMSLEQT